MRGQPDLFGEIIVDNFAGGGGASTGIELATGRVVDIAINHDPDAILMHKTNHPYTEHYQESVWDIDPVKVCRGRPVGLAWFSPDCKHFSKAKGGKPVDKNIRGLAWIVLRWAGKVRPRVIILENVEEFQTWGPVRKGKPIKDKAGQTFLQWVSQLEALGYDVEWRVLRACDYGAPTTRKRFFCVARRDGKPIVWPNATHGPGLLPYRAAAEIIDWSIPCPSIFEREKPLAEATMRRIARGIQKFVLDNPRPYIVPIGYGERHGQLPRVQDINQPLSTVVGTGKQYLVMPSLIQYHSEKPKDGVRGQELNRPIMTVDSSNRYGLVAAFISKFYGTSTGQRMDEPLHTITQSAGHFAEVRAFLIKYYKQGIGQGVDQPLDTIVSKERFGLVTVSGMDYYIADIGMRMLQPKELYAAQGFPRDYIIDRDYTGRVYPKSKQVARCGNAVPPQLAAALVKANLPEWCDHQLETMADVKKAVAI